MKKKLWIVACLMALAVPAVAKASTPHLPGHLVFSNYILYFTTYIHNPGPRGDKATIAAYKKDIQDAQNAGIDGFELFWYNGSQLVANADNMFEAAKELHDANPSVPAFQLFMSAQVFSSGDINQTQPGTSTTWIVYYLTRYASHPNYYHINGKPVLSSFNGSLSSTSSWDKIFNTLRKHTPAVNVFFVPAVQDFSPILSSGNTMTAWAKANLGSIRYFTATVTAGDLSGVQKAADIANANGKPVVASAEGDGYWSINNPTMWSYYEHSGGIGISAEWNLAIKLNSPYFMSDTVWNDWTESYDSPVTFPNTTVHAQSYGIEDRLKNHKGYDKLKQYFTKWYATGVKPTLDRDMLVYFYRTHPFSMVATSEPNKTAGNFHPATLSDDIIVTTEMRNPAILRVTSGGVVTTVNVPAGVTNTTITPFHPGKQLFEIIQGGVITISLQGEDIVANATKYNYFYTTGYMSSAQ